MKKLTLDALRVDSFATAAPVPGTRGTVAAHAATKDVACTYQCSFVSGCGPQCW